MRQANGAPKDEHGELSADEEATGPAENGTGDADEPDAKKPKLEDGEVKVNACQSCMVHIVEMLSPGGSGSFCLRLYGELCGET